MSDRMIDAIGFDGSELTALRHENENAILRQQLRTANATLANLTEIEAELHDCKQRLFEVTYAQKSVPSKKPSEGDYVSAALWLESGIERLRQAAGPTILKEIDDVFVGDVKAATDMACSLIKDGLRRGFFIINSAFEFKPEYNQRPIALAKEAAALGYFVVFVAWQWSPEETLEFRGRIFAGSILEIGRFDFDVFLQDVGAARLSDPGYFVLTIPSEDFVSRMTIMQTLEFATVYDVMDDWEEFSSVGQASWWSKEYESRAIQAADKVSVVSPVLREKFSNLRSDILLIPNGLRKMERAEKFSACREVDEGKIKLGYFGHLTDAWFDWEAVFELAERSKNLDINLIGYGEPDWVRRKLSQYSNIHLIGFVPAHELGYHVRDWHLGIIPFKDTILVRAVDPIKIYEYLYFGMPTISSGMPHTTKYPACYVVPSIAEASELCSELAEKLKSNKIDYTGISRFVNESTWRQRLHSMLGDRK